MRRFVPSPAMVVAVIALFVSLGGSAYAALVITGKNIKNGTVTTKDIRNHSLSGTDVRRTARRRRDQGVHARHRPSRRHRPSAAPASPW